MIVAGIMSGTSADGINVALVHLRGSSFHTRLELLAHGEYPYPAAVRRTVLAMMNAPAASVADLARLNFLLGELYAQALSEITKRTRLRPELVGCHGQTLYHQGEAGTFLGRKLAVTWQTGEGAVVAARSGLPVVSDFRPADMAAGGQGAPLVPFLDYVLYRHARVGRIILNIGGIANFTAIPSGASADEVMAFDTGPGNMVIDAITGKLFRRPFDRDGQIAKTGEVLAQVVERFSKLPFFRRRPPKTAGREQFGREFVESFLRACKRARKQDVVATATAVTAHTIATAARKFVLPGSDYREWIVSGGGARNPVLMRMLQEQMPELRIRRSDELGLPAEAKEAAAFALLAYQTWRHLPSNVAAATGARRPALLGKISYPPAG